MSFGWPEIFAMLVVGVPYGILIFGYILVVQPWLYRREFEKGNYLDIPSETFRKLCAERGLDPRHEIDRALLVRDERTRQRYAG